jgi:hypothetical protein
LTATLNSPRRRSRLSLPATPASSPFSPAAFRCPLRPLLSNPTKKP